MAATTDGMITRGSGLYTGPAGSIGAGTAYHIDINFSGLKNAGNYKEIVAVLDGMSNKLTAEGSRMEFCNEGVAGKVWDPSQPQAQKEALAKQLISAHNHSSSTSSIDFFIVDDGQDRGGKSSQDREMPLALRDGQKVEYGTGGNYGNHLFVKDAEGKLLYKMGHGNESKPLPKNFTVTGQDIAQSAAASVGVDTQDQDKAHEALGVITEVGDDGKTQIEREVEENGAAGGFGNLSKMFEGMGLGEGAMGMIMPLLLMFVMIAAGSSEEKAQEAKENYEYDPKNPLPPQELRDLDRANGRYPQVMPNGQSLSPELQQSLGDLPGLTSVQSSKENISGADYLSPPPATQQSRRMDVLELR